MTVRIRNVIQAAVVLLLFGAALILVTSIVSGRNLLTTMASAFVSPDPDPDDNETPDAKWHWHFWDTPKESEVTFGRNVYTSDANKAKDIHAEWLAEDPANLAAAANYLDHELPLEQRILNRQTGELVGAQCDAAIEDMISDQQYFEHVRDSVLEILKDAEVEVVPITKYGAWMWQSDVDGNGIPEVIIRDNPERYIRSNGHELIYTVILNDKEYKLHFRLECGFQPIMITWWEPPTTPPPSTTEPPKTTTVVTTHTEETTTTPHGPFKDKDQVVTDPSIPHENGYVDEGTSPDIAPEDRYIPGKETTTTTVAATDPTESSTTPKQSSTPQTTGPAATNTEDKIVPSTTVSIRPPEVTTPASDYEAPKEPALTSVAPVNGEIEIPE